MSPSAQKRQLWEERPEPSLQYRIVETAFAARYYAP
jgi:hypothetical protein